MSGPPSPVRDDNETLTRYLLGTLPETEAEPLDELSIADDEFAARLEDVENDLVDAYVRGQVSGSRRGEFETRYLASASGRDKVAFARALAAASARSARPRVAARVAADSRWMLAAAAVFLLAAGFLLAQNLRLRRELGDLRATGAALEERASELSARLEHQQGASAEAAQELTRLRDELARVRQSGDRGAPTAVATFLLMPAMRGGGGTEISIPPGAATVTLQVLLEAQGFSSYDAAITDAAGTRVWQGQDLRPHAAATGQIVSVSVPATAFTTDRYVLELNGTSPSGAREFVNTYPFRLRRR
jgi:hypothetical protein